LYLRGGTKHISVRYPTTAGLPSHSTLKPLSRFLNQRR
jgi:hypothetical protein